MKSGRCQYAIRIDDAFMRIVQIVVVPNRVGGGDEAKCRSSMAAVGDTRKVGAMDCLRYSDAKAPVPELGDLIGRQGSVRRLVEPELLGIERGAKVMNRLRRLLCQDSEVVR